jgi:hypothetical protein
MKVKIMVGSAHSYACIEHESCNMDVQLYAGHGPEYSLNMIALDLREKAHKMLHQAEIMEAAAAYLAGQGNLAQEDKQ